MYRVHTRYYMVCNRCSSSAQVHNLPSTNFAMVFTGNLTLDTPGQYNLTVHFS